MADPRMKSVIPLHHIFDATENDSSKTWTVPDKQVWKINWAQILLTSTDTVGDRHVRMELFDSDDNLLIDVHAGAVQAASLTRRYAFLQGIYRETAFVDDEIQVPIPQDLWIESGYKLTFEDVNEVDAAADDMTVSIQMERYKRG